MLALLRCLLATGWVLAAVAAGPAQKKGPHPPDAELERAIKERFAKSKIRTEGFQVRVENGVALLEGKTDVIQRKGTATRLARLAGARTVRNQIVVSEAAKEKAAANLDKGRRRAQVKRSEPR
jgi:osmotically-inducible protein OsmY